MVQPLNMTKHVDCYFKFPLLIILVCYIKMQSRTIDGWDIAMFDDKSTFSMVNPYFGWFNFKILGTPQPDPLVAAVVTPKSVGQFLQRSGLGSLPLTRVATPLVRNCAGNGAGIRGTCGQDRGDSW